MFLSADLNWKEILSIFKYNRHFVLKLLWPSRLPFPLRLIQTEDPSWSVVLLKWLVGWITDRNSKIQLLKVMCFIRANSNEIYPRKPFQITVYAIRQHQITNFYSSEGVARVQLFWSITTAPAGITHHRLWSASQLQSYLVSVQFRSIPQAHFWIPGAEPPQ